MAFPAMSHGANWYSDVFVPLDQYAAFPDKIDLFIKSALDATNYYQFAVAKSGLKFSCECKPHSIRDDNEGANSIAARDLAFTASVITNGKEWIAALKIPWGSIGGKPPTSFGLLPMRTRWRDGEISSPAPFEFAEFPPVDLFFEVPVGNRAPSSIFRWERPSSLSYPTAATRERIWQLEQSLQQPADKANLMERLELTQRWSDLLELEGFNFRPGSGSLVKEDLRFFWVRRSINAALLKNDVQRACSLLDTYLQKLDAVSRPWFADGSPGDIRQEEWQAIRSVSDGEMESNVLHLRCAVGTNELSLNVCRPVEGGFRIWAGREGFIKPAGLLRLKASKSANAYTIKMDDGKVVIAKNPFAIACYNSAGREILRLEADGIALRYGAGGAISGVDFKSKLDPEEVIYGFGERYDHFNQRGQILTLWGMDDWYGNNVGLANETYKPIGFLHSSRGYSIFDNSTFRLRADVGATRRSTMRLTQFGPFFDCYIWLGPPEKSLEGYASLTGKPILPPKWAFGPWAGRTGRAWENTPLHDPVAEAERVVDCLQELKIPTSAVYMEGVGADSRALNRFMAGKGLKVLSWFFCEIPRQTQAALMPDFKADQLPVLWAGSDEASDELGYVDFTNPNALELSRRWWQRRLDLGVAGSMVDFGDRVPEEAIFHDGRRGDEMHNFYAYDYQRTYSEVFREKRGDDFILFGRAAAPGTQKFAAQFAGDHPANFAGLKSVLTGALNLSACGFSTWGSDLGGFLGWPEPAVYMRWTEFACFCPLMRSHGRTPREPWYFGPDAVKTYTRYARIREKLVDYIYDSARRAHKTGMPLMRSMAVAFPGEPSLADVDDQYMFGPDLLVAPVVTEDNWRTIRFPSGKWTSLWDGSTIAGPATVKIEVPLDSIPVYVRPGASSPSKFRDARN